MKMSTENIVLYADSNFFSPYVMSVFVTLEEKGIPFDLKTIDLDARENSQAQYAALSLTCRVPTISQGNFSLSESSAITEYLEEAYPPPQFMQVYPESLKEKALARQIQAWLRSDFLAIRAERSTEVIFCSRQQPAPLSLTAAQSLDKLLTASDRLLAAGKPNLFGQWSIADTELALMLNRLIMNGDPIPEKFIQYARHQWQRASVQKWVTLSKTAKQ